MKPTPWRSYLVRWLCMAAACLAMPVAQAQIIEDVEVVEQGPDAVTRITFSASVRLLQQAPTTVAQNFQVRLEFTGATPAMLGQPVDEVRRQAGVLGVPGFSMTIKASPRQRVKMMQLQLAEPWLMRARPGPNNRSIDLSFSQTLVANAVPTPTPLPTPPPAPVVAPAQLAASSPLPAASAAVAGAGETEASPYDAEAMELLDKAKLALAARQNDRATEILNRLLRLPPNKASEEAQELIGLAWERAGDLDRARTEYQVYLKLHPEGDGANRVTQRMAALTPTKPPSSTQRTADSQLEPVVAKRPENRFSGNVAQYYFGGKARSQTLVTLPSGIDQSQLTKTTESAIVTSLDLGGRYVTGDHDMRFAVRGSGASNLAKNSHNASNINAIYMDYRRPSGAAMRLGRQSAISGGLLGLFDGLSLTYPLPEGMTVNLMGGVPANSLVSAPAERLAAAMLEADNIAEHWGGNVYMVQQTVEGHVNRSGLGTEIRYSDDVGSAYALLDYDTRFRVLNAASLQGSIQGPGQTSVTLLVDTRKAPSLQLSNALIAHSDWGTLKNAEAQGFTQADMIAEAKKVTANARQVMLSVSKPVSEKWQVTGDMRVSEVGALPHVGDFEAALATGKQYGLTVQLTGSNLYSKRDINNVNFSVLSTPFLKGYQLAINNLTSVMNSDVTLEPSLRIYTQTTTSATTSQSTGDKMLRLSPGMRVSYRLSAKSSVMGEGLLERSRSTTSSGNRDTINSVFFYVGYRMDLF